jgi:pantothenate kinase
LHPPLPLLSGLSHLLARHYEEQETRKRKKNKNKKHKKKKIPRITTTIKSFGAMVGEMVQAKYLADSVDHASGQVSF